MPPRKKAPAWLADKNPTTDEARLTCCRSCGAQVIRALVGSFAAVDVRADPAPLDPVAEIAARLSGRLTYCLSIRPHLKPRLLGRDPWHIAGGRCTHTVVTDHHCPKGPRR